MDFRSAVIRIAVALLTAAALASSGCTASQETLEADTVQQAKDIAKAMKAGMECRILGGDMGRVSMDSNREAFSLDCETLIVCSSGRDKKHGTSDDICQPVPVAE